MHDCACVCMCVCVRARIRMYICVSPQCHVPEAFADQTETRPCRWMTSLRTRPPSLSDYPSHRDVCITHRTSSASSLISSSNHHHPALSSTLTSVNSPLSPPPLPIRPKNTKRIKMSELFLLVARPVMHKAIKIVSGILCIWWRWRRRKRRRRWRWWWRWWCLLLLVEVATVALWLVLSLVAVAAVAL